MALRYASYKIAKFVIQVLLRGGWRRSKIAKFTVTKPFKPGHILEFPVRQRYLKEISLYLEQLDGEAKGRAKRRKRELKAEGEGCLIQLFRGYPKVH